MDFVRSTPFWNHAIYNYGYVLEYKDMGIMYRIHHGRDGKFRLYRQHIRGHYYLVKTYNTARQAAWDIWPALWVANQRGHVWAIDRI